MPSSKKAFITGVAGFVGGYLAAHLNERGYRVFGIDRLPECSVRDIDYQEGEILDTAAMARLFAAIRPDVLFHLAGVSFPSDADKSPLYALNNNIMGTVSILDAAFQSCASGSILLVGSSKQYGDAFAGDSVSEETPCVPTSYYGVSKYAAELIGRQYARQHGMDIRFTRSFNHTGPGQSERFVCSDWTKQAAAIKLGKAEAKISVGDTSPAVDIADVRDVVRAYLLILEKGTAGEVYNVCSGTAVSLRELLAAIVAKAGRNIAIEQDSTRIRKHKTAPRMVGDHSKLTRHTGWEPEFPLSRTIEDLYRYWLSELSSRKA